MILVVLFFCVWCSTLVEVATAWTNVDGVFYNDKGEVIKGALSKGIDVSYHQGIIDWGKVKQTDIEFVLIRCGYGDDDIGQDDKYFKQNIQGCSENNIQYGIYIYSHAINTEMAKSEVNHVLRLVRETNANPTYPIYYDIEANEQEKLSNDLLGNIAETFCNKILEAGYKVGIYSNLYWWNNRLTDKRFENWDKWVAQYNSSCDYSRQYNIWQFTDGGNGTGIPESVDVNILLARENVLTDISFKAEKGETIAVIGSTGSGKSTLVNLIPRFYDVTKGRILVDGVDVRDMTQKDVRSRLGYVPQKGILFSGTIDSNIRYGKTDISVEEVKEAAEVAQATEFIDAKPETYDSPISQGGTNVSGGQKQRLSIARAIAKKPEIFIFDDSFSALDFKTDSTLRKALKAHTKDATTIIVAQRISTILNADKIIVLDDGHMAGIGTHKELMKNCEVYRQIAMSQLSEEELA